MRFHLPSFLLGVVTGAGGAALAPRIRPVVLELATGCYRVLDSAMVRVARSREDMSDLLAEARARARALRQQPSERSGFTGPRSAPEGPTGARA